MACLFLREFLLNLSSRRRKVWELFLKREGSSTILQPTHKKVFIAFMIRYEMLICWGRKIILLPGGSLPSLLEGEQLSTTNPQKEILPIVSNSTHGGKNASTTPSAGEKGSENVISLC